MRRGENIFKRKDGRWEGRYITGRKENGKAIYRSVYAHSYKECSHKLSSAKILKKPINNNITLDRLYNEWITDKKNIIKASTLSTYNNQYKCYIKNKLGGYKIFDINSSMINAYVDELLNDPDNKGATLSVSTIRAVIIMLKSILSYGKSEYGINISINNISLPKIDYKETDVFDHNEVNRLILAADHSDIYDLGILICLYTGMRIGEICALRWGEIDINNKLIKVRNTLSRISSSDSEKKTKIIIDTPKSKNSVRDLPIPIALVNDIYRIALHHSDNDFFLTGTHHPMEPRSYRNHYRNMLSKSGVPYRKFHTLRHTFATYCISKGIDIKTVSTLLGHSSIKISLDRYVHPNLESEREKLSNIYL